MAGLGEVRLPLTAALTVAGALVGAARSLRKENARSILEGTPRNGEAIARGALVGASVGLAAAVAGQAIPINQRGDSVATFFEGKFRRAPPPGPQSPPPGPQSPPPGPQSPGAFRPQGPPPPGWHLAPGSTILFAPRPNTQQELHTYLREAFAQVMEQDKGSRNLAFEALVTRLGINDPRQRNTALKHLRAATGRFGPVQLRANLDVGAKQAAQEIGKLMSLKAR